MAGSLEPAYHNNQERKDGHSQTYDIFYFPNWELNYPSSPKMEELFEEKNYIKYGKGSKAIKYKDHVYISKHKNPRVRAHEQAVYMRES